jgi:hypothetical protein
MRKKEPPRARVKFQGRLVYRARVVWIKNRGVIPRACVIHHLNGITTDDRLSNLACLSQSEHRRIHSPNWEKFHGRWYRRCIACGQLKLPSGFYQHRKKWGKNRWTPNTQARCKPCYIRHIIFNRTKQKESA